MKRRLTDDERATLARDAVTQALEAARAGRKAHASALLAHAVHDGVQPLELMQEIADQTGGTL